MPTKRKKINKKVKPIYDTPPVKESKKSARAEPETKAGEPKVMPQQIPVESIVYPANVIQVLVNYLRTKPFNEVEGLLNALKTQGRRVK